MPLTRLQVLTRIGFHVAAQRNEVAADLMPNSLNDLNDLSPEDIKDACEAYPKRNVNAFNVPRLMISRLQGLCLWAKDRNRVDAQVMLPNATTAQEVAIIVREATEREKRRKEMKKTGENLIDTTFNNKLRNQAQWQKFKEELNATLSMIIGLKGVPLTYVVRPIEAQNFDEFVPYEDAVIQGVPLDGPEFVHDARIVHQIILHNVPENSDAYTYIKPVLRQQNGREDIVRLRERFETAATSQAVINQAKQTLSTLRYKSERSFPFEKFMAHLQHAYDELEDNGRPVNNGDIVDAMWLKIQAPDIQQYLASLKVDYQRNPRDYKLILQDIAGEVSSMNQTSFTSHRNVSQTNVSATYTREGNCPDTGVFTNNGEIYIGNYGRDKWFSESVKPYHQQIRDARQDDPAKKGSTSGNKRQASQLNRKKKQLKKLKAKIAAAKQKVESLTNTSDAESEPVDTDDKAGDSFGGKNSRKKKGKKKDE